MWKAIITSVSGMDVSGSVEIRYDIYIDDELIYPNNQFNGISDSFEAQTKQKMSELKTALEKANRLQVGDIITL